MMRAMILDMIIHSASLEEIRDAERAVPVMDDEEFRAFYDRTARPLWSYLSRITGQAQEADDILQEAYYRFYRAGATYESESHRRNSLFRIATNVARDAARRAKYRDHDPLDDEQPAVSRTPAPERQAAIRTDLAKALQRLEPMQREMLWLAYAQGASHEEIAEILGVRPMSIRTMLLRARRKMATFLGGVPQ